MIDLGWFGVLDVDRDVTLTTAVDLAARGGDMDTVGHIPALKFVDQFIHHRLDDARSIGARDITVQPALCADGATEFLVPPTTKPSASIALISG